ncbi:MAG: hypothetical protein OEU76_00250, partial [Cyclobacteriaceae bacterium]|nr:hypothetical protein [Cyclobacteriaceae bacterium]
MKLLLTVCQSVFLVVCFTIPSFSQNTQKKPMSVIDFLNIPGVSNPQLSPGGKQFTYELSESDWKKNKQIKHI